VPHVPNGRQFKRPGRTTEAGRLGSDFDARVDHPAPGAGRERHDRIQVQFRNFRNAFGKLRNPEQDISQCVDIGRRTPSKARQQGQTSNFMQQRVDVAIAQRRDTKSHVSHHLHVDPAGAEGNQGAEHTGSRVMPTMVSTPPEIIG
jgi:hypothetical protein